MEDGVVKTSITQPIEDRIDILENKIHELECMLVHQNGSNIQFVNNQTPELCEIAIESDPMSIRFIQEQNRTHRLCIKAIRLNPDCVQYIHSKDMHELAVSLKGSTLQYIPDEHKDYIMCADAIHKNPMVIQYVPQTDLFAPIWRQAIYHAPGCIKFLNPENKIYKDLANYAFANDCRTYRFIDNPSEEMTIEFIKRCNTQQFSDDLMDYIPEDKRTLKVRFCMLLKTWKFWYKS
jgi:hypothetical protein